MARSETLTNVDTAWWRMDSPTNLMMITGVMTFRGPLQYEHVRRLIEERLLHFDRFRQRIIEGRTPLGSPRWELDPHFDVHSHLHRIALPAPGGKAALQALVSDLMSTPLDYTKPLWQFHLVENVDGGSALIARLHHCVADGIALVGVLLSMTDETPDADWEPPLAKERRRGLRALLPGPLRSALDLTTDALHFGLEAALHPDQLLEMTRLGAGVAGRLARVSLYWPDPVTIFKGELGVQKRAAWSEPLPLAEVKAVGQVTGGTVNDVLLAAVAGALRRYLEGRDQPTDGLTIRAMVPVNLRPPDEALRDLGNKFGLVFLRLPVGIEDPFERLVELKRYMDEIKGSEEALMALTVLNVMGVAPNELEDLFVRFFGTKATAVMTNVPGPRQPLYVTGVPLETIMAWVPQSGRLGLGVSIFSYNGNVWVGVNTDARLVPDPETIVAAFADEFTALLALVDVAETAAAEPDRCGALTQAGRRCRNQARPGQRTCHIHAGVAVADAAHEVA
jgi:WS/DGAT/MGAT family acyltransferase